MSTYTCAYFLACCLCVVYNYKWCTEQDGIEVTLLTYILGVLSSYLGWDIGYPD
jgi:hypothetical protein